MDQWKSNLLRVAKLTEFLHRTLAQLKEIKKNNLEKIREAKTPKEPASNLNQSHTSIPTNTEENPQTQPQPQPNPENPNQTISEEKTAFEANQEQKSISSPKLLRRPQFTFFNSLLLYTLQIGH